MKDIHDYYEVRDEVLMDLLCSLRNEKKERIKLQKVKPMQYKRALMEFTKFGYLMRFPVKQVMKWKNLLLHNTMMLDIVTELFGHTEYFPYDEYYDFVCDEGVERNHNFSDAIDNLVEKGIDDLVPHFSNGADLISDYGLKPLLKLSQELLPLEDPNEIIVVMNKMLDVSHQRSDLSELFIEGGSESLYNISNN